MEKNGEITAYEVKLHRPRKTSSFVAFQELYPGSKTSVITIDTFIKGISQK